VALSWFPWARAEDEATAAAARDRVAAFARRHRKPLMIAEAAPKARFEADASDAWRGWHARVFGWIERNDAKAYQPGLERAAAVVGGLRPGRLGKHARAEARQPGARGVAEGDEPVPLAEAGSGALPGDRLRSRIPLAWTGRAASAERQ
jgi:hypothetical protein